MAFPPQQPGQPPQQTQPDSTVDAYERVVNGKVIKVNAYAKKPSTSTAAAATARKLPGRPRIAAKPGSYVSGRDIVGMPALPTPPPPPPPMYPWQQPVPGKPPR